ncbi:hypothetical protein KIN20_014193 [Parelaphostrongylus tenuis]|uniref:Uncharacterized protein n=1 Tax=Parelaphostrongylus tenuis TaxID=148309 RepID=A0AAD5MVL4_PARTN|nr:hypothetical protein KIN20_014193 [Parelaphostrongylus tenuis]
MDQLTIQINYEPLECKESTLITPQTVMVMGDKAKKSTLRHCRQHGDRQGTREEPPMIKCEFGKMGKDIECRRTGAKRSKQWMQNSIIQENDAESE